LFPKKFTFRFVPKNEVGLKTKSFEKDQRSLISFQKTKFFGPPVSFEKGKKQEQFFKNSKIYFISKILCFVNKKMEFITLPVPVK
jgi:hypothetical protein